MGKQGKLTSHLGEWGEGGCGVKRARKSMHLSCTSRNLKSGLRVKHIPSWVNKERITSENLSGIRMGYWYTNWLNFPAAYKVTRTADMSLSLRWITKLKIKDSFLLAFKDKTISEVLARTYSHKIVLPLETYMCNIKIEDIPSPTIILPMGPNIESWALTQQAQVN